MYTLFSKRENTYYFCSRQTCSPIFFSETNHISNICSREILNTVKQFNPQIKLYENGFIWPLYQSRFSRETEPIVNTHTNTHTHIYTHIHTHTELILSILRESVPGPTHGYKNPGMLKSHSQTSISVDSTNHHGSLTKFANLQIWRADCIVIEKIHM